MATFTSLSDMCSFTVSPSTNRWYWHHEGNSQFGGSDESIGYCTAAFASTTGSTATTGGGLGMTCTSGTGACARTGTFICNPAGTDTTCSVMGSSPTAEICDNVDNDCNGIIDDGLVRSCYTGGAGTAGVGA